MIISFICHGEGVVYIESPYVKISVRDYARYNTDVNQRITLTFYLPDAENGVLTPKTYVADWSADNMAAHDLRRRINETLAQNHEATISFASMMHREGPAGRYVVFDEVK